MKICFSQFLSPLLSQFAILYSDLVNLNSIFPSFHAIFPKNAEISWIEKIVQGQQSLCLHVSTILKSVYWLNFYSLVFTFSLGFKMYASLTHCTLSLQKTVIKKLWRWVKKSLSRMEKRIRPYHRHLQDAAVCNLVTLVVVEVVVGANKWQRASERLVSVQVKKLVTQHH